MSPASATTIVRASGSAARSASRRFRQRAVVLVPDRPLHGGDAVEVLPFAHLTEVHTVREDRLRAHGGHQSDHHRLALLGNEAGHRQPLAEVGGSVMFVQLPLERVATLREQPHLSCDQRVDLDVAQRAEVPIVHEATIREPRVAQQRSVPLDVHAGRQVLWRVGP